MMLDLELLDRVQRLIEKVMKDQPDVVSLGDNRVHLKHEAFVDAFREYDYHLDKEEDLHLSAYHDGVKYVAVVLTTDPLYAKLKENAPAGRPSGQGAQTKSTTKV